MRTVTTWVAAALIVSSGPAFASSGTAQSKQPAPTKAANASPNAKYCVQSDSEAATGSRIYTRECKTKAEWAKQGVDIDEALKQD